MTLNKHKLIMAASLALGILYFEQALFSINPTHSAIYNVLLVCPPASMLLTPLIPIRILSRRGFKQFFLGLNILAMAALFLYIFGAILIFAPTYRLLINIAGLYLLPHLFNHILTAKHSNKRFRTREKSSFESYGD